MGNFAKRQGRVSYVFSIIMYLFLIVGLLVVPMVQAFTESNYFSSYNEGGMSFLGFSRNMLKSLSVAAKPYELPEKYVDVKYFVFWLQRIVHKSYGFFYDNIVTISILICWIILVTSIILVIVSSIRFLKYGKTTRVCNIIALVMYIVYGFLGVTVAIFCGIFSNNLLDPGLPIGSYYYFSLSFIVTIIGVILYLIIKRIEKRNE